MSGTRKVLDEEAGVDIRRAKLTAKGLQATNPVGLDGWICLTNEYIEYMRPITNPRSHIGLMLDGHISSLSALCDFVNNYTITDYLMSRNEMVQIMCHWQSWCETNWFPPDEESARYFIRGYMDGEA